MVTYKPQDGSEKVGLYVKAKDCFYTTEQPLIKYDLFYDINSGLAEENKDNTYALFVPRKDLINGEIIQLRLTEKGHNKKMLDFRTLDKDYGFNTFRDPANPQKGETYSKLFLSLHNCFANIPAQYNFRTTLFFDSTTPENVGTTQGRPFKNVNDWFCNGIECQYFKPNMIKEGEDTKIGTNQVLRTDLQIKASMLAKKTHSMIIVLFLKKDLMMTLRQQRYIILFHVDRLIVPLNVITFYSMHLQQHLMAICSFIVHCNFYRLLQQEVAKQFNQQDGVQFQNREQWMLCQTRKTLVL